MDLTIVLEEFFRTRWIKFDELERDEFNYFRNDNSIEVA